MRPTLLFLGSSLALAGLVSGCAEAPPPVAPTTPVAAVAVEPPAPPPVDLAPVEEPADLFAIARWRSPNATLTSLGTCAGVPQTLVDNRARDLLDRALAHAFRNGVDGRRIADLVALDASVDVVASLDAGRRQPDALVAFSVGLTSLEQARGALEAAGPLVELEPGLWRVGSADGGDPSCVIGPAAGPAPARLICGPRDKDVARLGPYLARNVSVAPPPARDVHAELRFTPFEARYGSDLRRLLGWLPNLARMRAVGEPRFDRALEDIAVALGEEGKALVSDLDRVTLDAGAAGGAGPSDDCLTVSGALDLRGESSWIARTLAARSDGQGPPPPIFWRAPVDSESASYGRAADPARYGDILHDLRDLLEGLLAREQIGSEADREALGALLALPLHKDTGVVVASGHASTMGETTHHGRPRGGRHAPAPGRRATRSRSGSPIAIWAGT